MNKYRIGDILVTMLNFPLGEEVKTVYTIVGVDRKRNNEYFYKIEYYRKDISSFYCIYEHEQVIDRWISMHFVEYYPASS